MTIPNALSKKPAPKASGHLPAPRPVVKTRGQTGNSCFKCGFRIVALVMLGFACAALILYRQYGQDLNLHSYHDGDQVLARR